MNSHEFDWKDTKQLSLIQVFLAFALPSAFAFAGFHLVLPSMVARGVPVLIAWPIIAAVMLSILVIFAVVVMRSEAQELNISVKARMCLNNLSVKQWGVYALIMIVGLAFAALASQFVKPFSDFLNLSIPSYMPFFLDPSINPLEAAPEQVSPGFAIKGQLILLPLFSIALLLNILAEELYFRAWLLPKMARFGKWSWGINGLLFALYHTFQFWLFPTILVGSLIWAFVIYRSKSIYPALVGHFVGNFLGSILGIVYLVLA